MKKCNEICFECSFKGLGHYWLRVDNALQNVVDAPALLKEISEVLDTLQGKADKVSKKSQVPFTHVNSVIKHYLQFQRKLENALANSLVNEQLLLTGGIRKEQ